MLQAGRQAGREVVWAGAKMLAVAATHAQHCLPDRDDSWASKNTDSIPPALWLRYPGCLALTIHSQLLHEANMQHP